MDRGSFPNKRWTPQQRRYIQWLALPEKLREPPTEDDLAEELKRQPATLHRWQKQPGFKPELDRAIGIRLLRRKANIYDVIGEKAEAGDFRYVKMVLEMMGHYPISNKKEPVRTPMKPDILEKYAGMIPNSGSPDCSKIENKRAGNVKPE